MCFRPPTTSKPKKCTQCGTMNPPTANECKTCKASLVVEDTIQKAD